jgi:YVTN family beta-propeller protein
MTRICRRGFRVLKVLLLAWVVISPVLVAAGDKSSSIKVSPDGTLLAVVNADSRSVTLVSLPGEEKVVEIFVGRSPQTVAFDPAGTHMYVTNRLDDTVSVIDLANVMETDTIAVPDEPFGIVASPDRLYVSSTQASTIVVVDPESGMITNTIATGVHPRGLALSPDASELFVSHFSTGRLSVIDTTNLEVQAVISTGADSNLSQGITLSEDGTRAWLPHTRSNVGNDALLFDTTVFPVVSVVDLSNRLHIPSERIHLDISDVPVNMPFDTALADGEVLFVLNAGSNDLSVIDLQTAKSLAHIEVGDNPRAMTMSTDKAKLYVNNTLSGTVSIVDTVELQVTGAIQVTHIPMAPNLLNGKILFNSSDRVDLARDQWISCATCHFEGEMDGRTWMFPDGPRNTTSLLGVADTLPIHWSGDLDELQDVEITVRGIQAGTGLAPGPDNCSPACDQAEPNSGRSQDLDDLAAFMASLDLSPNPNLALDGSLNDAAVRGKIIFESTETGCSDCHLAPLYSDAQQHDVGTGADPGERKGTTFDTPSLRGIYKTAPYLHHGIAETLVDVLTTHNPEDLHGKTSHLQESDLQDLVVFLNSLGTERAFEINSGLNDAWVNLDTLGQGFFFNVFPVLGKMFVAMFTYDTERPPEGVTATLGGPGQRWLTGLGDYDGNVATVPIELTSGGVFNSGVPAPGQSPDYGTFIIEFHDCNSATVSYSVSSLGLNGVIPVSRAAPDNVALCEALNTP